MAEQLNVDLQSALALHVRFFVSHMYQAKHGRYHTCEESLRYHPLRPFFVFVRPTVCACMADASRVACRCAPTDLDIIWAVQQHQQFVSRCHTQGLSDWLLLC